ncbi:hypothetical protein [Sphingomonas sp. PAMC 26621]|uniref:hypothetical protein n=1 Tax=Sphingomonas sp. PAMC 26621 TaxID=1112213 RepID=UPI00028825D4|nr:hypothetical protein [Sphingomonas sp. PAMC 26621]
MIHATIECAGASPIGGKHGDMARWAEALATVARDIDSRFVVAGEALAGAYGIVERIVASLEAVSQALEGEAVTRAVADMHAIADRLTQLPSTQVTRQAALVTIGGSGTALRNPLARFDRTLRFLRICGLNIKVAAAGADGFGGFADMMIDRLDVAETEMRSFAMQLETVTRGVAAAQAAEQSLARESARVIPEVPRRLSRDALALQEEQASAGILANRIVDAAREVRGKIATAIGALQIGDITRQRLEHVVAGLVALQALAAPAPDETVQAHVLALLAAQATDTTADFTRQAALLTQTLRDVGPHATALIALTGDRPPSAGGSAPGDAPLELLEQSIDEVRALAGRLQEADAISDRIGSATLVTAEALAQRLLVIQRVTLDVQQMAWNTDLRSRPMGDAGRGLGAVALEIRNFSLELERFSADIAAMCGQITGAAQAMHAVQTGTSRVDVSHALDVSLQCVRDGGRVVREGLFGLEVEASELNDFVDQTARNIACDTAFGSVLESTSAALADAGSSIAALDEAPPELSVVLAQIAATYSMARERDVHQRFAMIPAEAMIQPTIGLAASDDEDDDGLF